MITTNLTAMTSVESVLIFYCPQHLLASLGCARLDEQTTWEVGNWLIFGLKAAPMGSYCTLRLAVSADPERSVLGPLPLNGFTNTTALVKFVDHNNF